MHLLNSGMEKLPVLPQHVLMPTAAVAKTSQNNFTCVGKSDNVVTLPQCLRDLTQVSQRALGSSVLFRWLNFCGDQLKATCKVLCWAGLKVIMGCDRALYDVLRMQEKKDRSVQPKDLQTTVRDFIESPEKQVRRGVRACKNSWCSFKRFFGKIDIVALHRLSHMMLETKCNSCN